MEKCEDERNVSLRRAIQIYQARRERARIFDADGELFGEPAWDILLDLYIARERGQPVCLTDASLGAGVPLSTAQRWVKQLLARGMLERQDDKHDARRVLITISDKVASVMRLYLERHDPGSRIDSTGRRQDADNFLRH